MATVCPLANSTLLSARRTRKAGTEKPLIARTFTLLISLTSDRTAWRCGWRKPPSRPGRISRPWRGSGAMRRMAGWNRPPTCAPWLCSAPQPSAGNRRACRAAVPPPERMEDAEAHALTLAGAPAVLEMPRGLLRQILARLDPTASPPWAKARRMLL